MKLKKTIRRILKLLLRFIIIVLILGISGYFYVYLKQEEFFFQPKILAKDYQYKFDTKFEEYDIEVKPEIKLNALLFKAKDSAKGLILYFHGNAGALHEWGLRAPLYTNNNYDILMVDYRGYGKSNGFYSEESQIYNDAQKVYDFAKSKYEEQDIIVLGFSLGSGFAAYTASQNNPKLLILEAPYYAWDESISNIAPFPKWMVNYEIPTYKFLEDVTCPIKIYYGSRDFLIDPTKNTIPLKKLYPNKIDVTVIDFAGHNGIYITKQYYDILTELLE